MTGRARRIEDICKDIADEAENISRTFEKIGERSKPKPDWREYLKKSPYLALGAATVLGYAASRLFQARCAPPEQIMEPDVRNSPDNLLSGSAGLSLIKVTLLGVAAKAVTNWIMNASSSSGTCCGGTELRPKTGSDSTIKQREEESCHLT